MQSDQPQTTVPEGYVLVPKDEYNLLRAVYDLVKSPDGIAKIAGTFVPTGDTVSFDELMQLLESADAKAT